LLEYIIVIVSILNVESIFVSQYLHKENDGDKDSEMDMLDNTVSKPKRVKAKALLDLKFINNSSDFITQMNIMISLLNSLKNNFRNLHLIKEFCEKYSLNFKIVNEVLSLISQLKALCVDIFRLNKNIWSSNIEQPNSRNQLLLFQIILGGLIDNIARKKVIYNNNENEVNEVKGKGESDNKRKVIYECNQNNVECQIHSESMVSKETPNFVAYKEIIQEKNKANLVTVMSIQPEWIFNLGGDLINYSFDKLNVNLEPIYSSKDDLIYCFINMKYGYKSWEINNVKVDMTDSNSNDVVYRWFARLLLEGKIIDRFKVSLFP